MEPRVYKALGLMSGTSLDGIDAAVLETDGLTVGEIGPTAFYPYTDEERALLQEAQKQAPAYLRSRMRNTPLASPAAKLFAEANACVTQTHAALVKGFLEEHKIRPEEMAVIGFHGQTLIHAPALRCSLQIGNGQYLANTLGICVIDGFRQLDLQAGGQGAPLVPLFHQALARATSVLPRPLVVLNIGGIANVTWIGPERRGSAALQAFDVGPGNALSDDFIQSRCGKRFDQNGRGALSGQVSPRALAELLSQIAPYLARTPPKSLDRNAFSLTALEDLSTEDGLATLAALTVHCILRAWPHFPTPPRCVVALGGGVHNQSIMTRLAHLLHAAPYHCTLCKGATIGWESAFVEAQAFAFLAVRSLRNLPLTLPSTTGVPRPLPGGFLHHPTLKSGGRDS